MTAEVGQTLRRAREEQQLSLEEISKELHIRVAYLQALEAEDFNRLPAPTQARGFLRLYSDYLHLPTKELVEAFRKAQNPDLYAQTEEDLNDSPDLGSAVDDTVTLILQEIGHDLKKQRENLGLSKADVEAHTHIPDHYVNYLESGDINQFPSPTQARGMLANYANFLDLDSDDIMLRYANALQTELFTRQAEQSAEDAAAPSRVRPKFRAPASAAVGANVLIPRPDPGQHYRDRHPHHHRLGDRANYPLSIWPCPPPHRAINCRCSAAHRHRGTNPHRHLAADPNL